MDLTVRDQEYLEAMLFLVERKGAIRVCDLARELGVRPASVVDALERLAEKGLVEYRKREEISLTETGLRMAREIAHRHRILKRFFVEVLGISEEVAERDACYLEHGIHAETLERILLFLKFISRCSRDKPNFLKHFQVFVETGECPEECEERRGRARPAPQVHV